MSGNHRYTKLFLTFFIVLLTTLLQPAPTQAAVTLEVRLDKAFFPNNGCGTALFTGEITVRFDTDPSFIGIHGEVLQADGQRVRADVYYVYWGEGQTTATSDRVLQFRECTTITESMTTAPPIFSLRPATMVIYQWGSDVPLGVYIFDPADWMPEFFGDLPISEPYIPPGTIPIYLEPFIDDGRLSYDGDANVAIYPLHDGSIEIYGINDKGEGYSALLITADDLAALPDTVDENLLVAEFGDIAFYKLTTGEYQVNVGPDEEGKVQVYILDHELTTIVRRADFNVYDILE